VVNIVCGLRNHFRLSLGRALDRDGKTDGEKNPDLQEEEDRIVSFVQCTEGKTV
jgi:hypothetical protein